MKKLFYLLPVGLLLLLSFTTFAQSVTSVQVYKRDTAFTSITVDTAGNVWAGTNGKGMVKYDRKKWYDWNGFGVAFLKGNIRQIATVGNDVWVASSGYVLYLGSPDAGNNNNFWGGMHKVDNRIHIKRTYYKGKPVLGQNPNAGPPTRNILGLCIDNSGIPWCAGSYHDSLTYPAFLNYNARYHFAPGATGRFNGTNFTFLTGPAMPDPTGILIGVGNNYQTESYSIGKRRTCRSIVQVGSEMWVGTDGYDQAAGNLITAGILRYDLAGNYIGKFDENNTPVPFGLTNSSFGPWALYKDSIGRVWAAMNGNKGIAVRDTNNVWTYIGVPPNLPAATIFRANAITGNSRGEVFFGTGSGLLVYKGRGSFTSDTSYTVFTTAQGLSSNSIFGVAVAKDESIWMATSLGVNKLNRGDLHVYNRKPFYTIFTDSDVFRTTVLEYDSRRSQADIDKDTLLIAADGGKATIFKWNGSSPEKLKFRILQDIDGQNPDEFGSFSIRHQDNDSVRVLYSHPKFLDGLYTVGSGGRNVRLQLVDSTQNPALVMIDIPVKFVLPPVLMIHGVWSSTGSFTQMENALLGSLNNYKPYRLLKIWYPTDVHPEPVASQAAYKYEVPDGISKLIENCALNKMSAGRVDILGHSRGGIFARIYLQEKYVKYRNDINKLITLNTPHSGSQTANLALDNRRIPMLKQDPFTEQYYMDSSLSLGAVFRWLTLETYDDLNGAIELKVNSPAITQDLNGPGNLNKNTAYSHVLVGRQLFGASTFSQLLSAGLFRGSGTFSARLAALLLSIPGGSVDNFFKQIFDGEFNDVVVPESSQRAGLADAYTSRFPTINVAHSTKSFAGLQTTTGVLQIPEVHGRIGELLRADPRDGLFTTDGFNPPRLDTAYTFLKPNPHFLVGQAERILDNQGIRIDTALDGTVYHTGDTVFVHVSKVNIDSMLIRYSGKSIDVYSDAHFGNDTTFVFPLPAEAVGPVDIEVFGFNAGNVAYDSARVFVNVPASVVLDSIKIAHPSINDIKIPLGDSTNISVMGYYHDGIVRNVTYQPGVTYGTLGGAVSTSALGNVKGLVLGFDQLIANYLGKADSAYVEVIPKAFYDTVPITVVPVKFLKVNAFYQGKNVKVTWATATELNNHHFEIEHSANGKDFVKAGSVAATNSNNGSSYYFNHEDFVIGKNYYRIKQVDINGTATYSDIAVANVAAKSSINIYPNPADAVLTIDFAKAADNNAGSLRIINKLGQVMQQQKIAAGSLKATVNIATLAPGIYTIEIINAGNKSIRAEKFIKNR